jgi:hypothetical protein
MSAYKESAWLFTQDNWFDVLGLEGIQYRHPLLNKNLSEFNLSTKTMSRQTMFHFLHQSMGKKEKLVKRTVA